MLTSKWKMKFKVHMLNIQSIICKFWNTLSQNNQRENNLWFQIGQLPLVLPQIKGFTDALKWKETDNYMNGLVMYTPWGSYTAHLMVWPWGRRLTDCPPNCSLDTLYTRPHVWFWGTDSYIKLTFRGEKNRR